MLTPEIRQPLRRSPTPEHPSAKLRTLSYPAHIEITKEHQPQTISPQMRIMKGEEGRHKTQISTSRTTVRPTPKE